MSQMFNEQSDRTLEKCQKILSLFKRHSHHDLVQSKLPMKPSLRKRINQSVSSALSSSKKQGKDHTTSLISGQSTISQMNSNSSRKHINRTSISSLKSPFKNLCGTLNNSLTESLGKIKSKRIQASYVATPIFQTSAKQYGAPNENRDVYNCKSFYQTPQNKSRKTSLNNSRNGISNRKSMKKPAENRLDKIMSIKVNKPKVQSVLRTNDFRCQRVQGSKYKWEELQIRMEKTYQNKNKATKRGQLVETRYLHNPSKKQFNTSLYDNSLKDILSVSNKRSNKTKSGKSHQIKSQLQKDIQDRLQLLNIFQLTDQSQDEEEPQFRQVKNVTRNVSILACSQQTKSQPSALRDITTSEEFNNNLVQNTETINKSTKNMRKLEKKLSEEINVSHDHQRDRSKNNQPQQGYTFSLKNPSGELFMRICEETMKLASSESLLLSDKQNSGTLHQLKNQFQELKGSNLIQLKDQQLRKYRNSTKKSLKNFEQERTRFEHSTFSQLINEEMKKLDAERQSIRRQRELRQRKCSLGLHRY